MPNMATHQQWIVTHEIVESKPFSINLCHHLGSTMVTSTTWPQTITCIVRPSRIIPQIANNFGDIIIPPCVPHEIYYLQVNMNWKRTTFYIATMHSEHLKYKPTESVSECRFCRRQSRIWENVAGRFSLDNRTRTRALCHNVWHTYFAPEWMNRFWEIQLCVYVYIYIYIYIFIDIYCFLFVFDTYIQKIYI